MAIYNLTNLTSATNVYDLVVFANDVTSSNGYNILAITFVFGVFFVALLALKEQDFSTNLAVSSFIAFVLSGMLWFANMVIPMIPLAFLIILALDILYIYSRG